MSRVNIREIRRKQILRAARRLAAQQGWAATSVADICQEADISTGVFTYHFQDKDELLFALLEDVVTRLREHFLETRPVQGSLAEQVAAFVRLICQLATSDPELHLLLLHLIAASAQRPAIAQRLHMLFAEIRQRLVERLEAHQEDEEFRLLLQSHNPVVLVNLIQSAGLGMMLGRTFLGIDLQAEQMEQEATALLLAGLHLSSPQYQQADAEKNDDVTVMSDEIHAST